MPPLKFDMKSAEFSDGCMLSYQIGKPPMLSKTDRSRKLPESHSKVVINEEFLNIKLPVRIMSSYRVISITGPVTVKKLANVISKFYKTKISAKEYAWLRSHDSMKAWGFTDFAKFKTKIKTYAHLQGDHVFLDGFSNNTFTGSKWTAVFGS
jgi:hypothetical protein